MARIKRGTTANKRRKNVLKDAKGFRWGRNSKYRLAKDALAHAWAYAFRDRRAKKRVFRAAWQTTIGGAAAIQGINYSRLMHALRKNDIQIDRKILAELARNHPETFEHIVTKVK